MAPPQLHALLSQIAASQERVPESKCKAVLERTIAVMEDASLRSYHTPQALAQARTLGPLALMPTMNYVAAIMQCIQSKHHIGALALALGQCPTATVSFLQMHNDPT
jgi:hypothetical protein